MTTTRSCPGCGADILVNEGVEFTHPANWCVRCGGTAPTEAMRTLRASIMENLATNYAHIDDCGEFVRVHTKDGRRYVVTVREEI